MLIKDNTSLTEESKVGKYGNVIPFKGPDKPTKVFPKCFFLNCAPAEHEGKEDIYNIVGICQSESHPSG